MKTWGKCNEYVRLIAKLYLVLIQNYLEQYWRIAYENPHCEHCGR